MNMQLTQPNEMRRSIDRCKLFSEMTKKRRTQEKEEKMVCTKDTIKSQQSENFNMAEFDFHFENKIQQFKMMKAEQIAAISIDGDIPVKNIIKRIKPKLQKELFEHILKTIKEMDMYEERSAQKTMKSSKYLGSTIEHTSTPKSIQTPAFEFESIQQAKIKQFSVGSNEFTLNPKSTEEQKMKENVEKEQNVSEFTLGSRNPTSKRIKDKIMNSRRANVH